METCKTCDYCNRRTDDYTLKKCGDFLGWCRCKKFVYTGDNKKTQPNGLGYWDSESYGAGFETGANFGCIHHTKSLSS